MRLTETQLAKFEREGWLLQKNLFSAEEVSVLTKELPRIFSLRREEVVR